ncbi:MAG: hypothetical protein AAFP90_13020 [Planctomycetota bacterium]
MKQSQILNKTRGFAMIKEGQVKQIRRCLDAGHSLNDAARMAVMDRKTARKYHDKHVSDAACAKRPERDYRTRVVPFADVWEIVQQRLEQEPRLRAFTLFEWLQNMHPGTFPDSTRRTFERRVAQWRAENRPPKEVFIPQVHQPG